MTSQTYTSGDSSAASSLSLNCLCCQNPELLPPRLKCLRLSLTLFRALRQRHGRNNTDRGRLLLPMRATAAETVSTLDAVDQLLRIAASDPKRFAIAWLLMPSALQLSMRLRRPGRHPERTASTAMPWRMPGRPLVASHSPSPPGTPSRKPQLPYRQPTTTGQVRILRRSTDYPSIAYGNRSQKSGQVLVRTRNLVNHLFLVNRGLRLIRIR